jgi:hypothetical protein
VARLHSPAHRIGAAERELREGYLIGARITEMAEGGRSRLATYLGTLG